jgi:hypothetical protein
MGAYVAVIIFSDSVCRPVAPGILLGRAVDPEHKILGAVADFLGEPFK